jgi:hypothetical protein
MDFPDMMMQWAREPFSVLQSELIGIYVSDLEGSVSTLLGIGRYPD